MSGTAFIGEVRMYCGKTAPAGWLFCDGRELPVNAEWDNLYYLIFNTYGGEPDHTFKLPDLRGRVPVHRSDTLPIGRYGGAEKVTLGDRDVAPHTHDLTVSSKLASTSTPKENVPAQSGTVQLYVADDGASGLVALDSRALTTAGGGQPHENMHPFVTVNYIIAYEGRMGGAGDE